jgi:hypothetical protein
MKTLLINLIFLSLYLLNNNIILVSINIVRRRITFGEVLSQLFWGGLAKSS